MISSEETLKVYGYSIESIRPKSHKRIIAICNRCGEKRSLERGNYRDLCLSCSIQVKKENGINCGKKNGQYKNGWTMKKTFCSDCGIEIWPKSKRCHSCETKKRFTPKRRLEYKMRLCGGNSPNYKDGRTPLTTAIRHLSEYKQWIRNVFIRDSYTCQDCYQHGVYLHAHHIKEFHFLLNDFLQTYPQFSVLEDKEILIRLALTYSPFWDCTNGKTLCRKCHKNIRHNR